MSERCQRPDPAPRAGRRPEAGQVSVIVVPVVGVLLVIVYVIASIGGAVLHRSRARTAADAVALAAVAGDQAANELKARYRDQGIDVIVDVDPSHDQTAGPVMRAATQSGSAGATSWAETAEANATRAPALVAILARAGQLTGTAFVPIAWGETSMTLVAGDASRFELVAAELGMCPVVVPGGSSSAFELC